MLKLKNKKKNVFPTKKTLNLLQRDKEEQTPARIISMVFVLALIVFFVFKFGVIDQMYRYYTATSKADELEKRLATTQAQNENYSAVFDEYSRYFYTGFTEAESARVGRLEAIKLIDDYLLTMGFTGSYTIAENTIALNLKGITLTQTAALINVLTQNEMVVSVPIQAAGSDMNSPQTVNMSVVLKKVGQQQ